MVRHVEGWKLKISIDKDQNVLWKSFSGAKVKCVKDLNPVIREKSSDRVILYVRKNECNSELLTEKIAKSIIDVAKRTQSDKVMEVNKELFKMCDKRELHFLTFLTRKFIWIKIDFTSNVMIMKCLVRNLELRNDIDTGPPHALSQWGGKTFSKMVPQGCLKQLSLEQDNKMIYYKIKGFFYHKPLKTHSTFYLFQQL